MPILIVDSDPDTRRLLRRILAELDFPAAVTADTAEAAIARLSSEIELALVNIRLPVLDGVECCRLLRSAPGQADLPVLMLSTDPHSPSLARAYAAGAMDYLRLPLDLGEFGLRVRSALRLGREIRNREARERDLQASLAALHRDLQAAGRLQRRLLPTRSEPVAGVRAAWHFAPCDEVGGDLLDVLVLPDGAVACYLLDVAGHGVPAALFSVGLRHLISAREAASPLLGADGSALSPDKVAAVLNREFQMTDDTLQYFTMVYAILAPALGELRFVQAGHPGLIACLPGRPASVIGEGDLPIGMLPQASYQTLNLHLPPGGRVVMYSDGVTEATDGLGRMFGVQRLLEAIEASRHRALPDMVAAINDAVCAWLGGGQAKDDISVLSLERTAHYE
jgi:sigma-B regulation protein RsbU (phosphoserine phosphatase)